MGKLTKFTLIYCLGAVGVVTALGSLGSTLDDEIETYAPPESSNDPFSEVALAAKEPAPVVEKQDEPPLAERSSQQSSPPANEEMDQIDHMIGATINLSGHLCARPIEVKEAGDGLYGVRCVTNRNGTGISDYIINSRTSEVIPI